LTDLHATSAFAVSTTEKFPRNKHKALGGRDKTETLAAETKQRVVGQVVDHHHDQEKAAQSVDPRVASPRENTLLFAVRASTAHCAAVCPALPVSLIQTALSNWLDVIFGKVTSRWSIGFWTVWNIG
jgi:hypothetical protein